jgi:hypothetical protein
MCAYYAFEKEKIARRQANQDLLEDADAQDDHLEKGSWELSENALNKWPKNSVLTGVPSISIEGVVMGTFWN